MRGLLLVFSDAADGALDAYHDWYDTVHLPAVLDVAGFTAARRYAAVPSVHGELPPRPYLAAYEIETDDLEGAQVALSAAAKEMEISPAFDRGSTITYTYQLIAEAEAL